MTLNTVNGGVKRIFEIKKIKPDKNIIHALSSAQVEQIGIQKGHIYEGIHQYSGLLARHANKIEEALHEAV